MAEGDGLSLGDLMVGFYNTIMELPKHEACRKSTVPLQSHGNAAGHHCVRKRYNPMAKIIHEEAGRPRIIHARLMLQQYWRRLFNKLQGEPHEIKPRRQDSKNLEYLYEP